jgi:hypothetical protein
MSSFSKKFVSTYLSDTVNSRVHNVVRLFDMPLKEVKVEDVSINSYIVIAINPYTLEEELKTYPVVTVLTDSCPYTVINFK